MPHTNRKKKGAAATESSSNSKTKTQVNVATRTKRVLVDDQEGWTHVIDSSRKGSSNRSRAGKPARNEANVLHAGDWEKDGVAYVDMNVKDMEKELEFWGKGWVESRKDRELRGVLERRAAEVEGTEKETDENAREDVRDEQSRERMEVKNVVCLGLGSLQSARREGRRASFTQLAALRDLLNVVGHGSAITCFFQDPQFTDVDKEFLNALGYTVIDDPDAFEHIDESTLVYAIHCYARLYRSISEGKRPAVIVGTDVQNFGKFDLSEEAEAISKQLEEMVKDCEVLDFPQLRHDFSDTKVYWRGASHGSGS